MANPQIEDGHTKIANDIIEALSGIRIPGEAVQILFVIIRKTYGFNKKSDRIALCQFFQMTGIRKSHISRGIEVLEAMNIIIKNVPNNGKGTIPEYSINKDFDTWKPFPKKGNVPNNGKGVPNNGKKSSQKRERAFPIMGTTKDNIQKTKDNSTKDMLIPNNGKSDFEEFWAIYPRKIEKKRALKCFLTRKKEGVSPETLIIAAENYAHSCRAKETEQDYIKHASTFLGPDKPYEDWVNSKEKPQKQEEKPSYHNDFPDWRKEAQKC